jgi:hypothetical protein
MRRQKFVVLDEQGPDCPRCGYPMQAREHDRIRAKQLRKAYYYRRGLYCIHKNCRTTTVIFDEFKVFNSAQERRQQLRPRETSTFAACAVGSGVPMSRRLRS